MSRELDNDLEAAQNAPDTETHDLMVITLPQMAGDFEQIVLYVATSELTVDDIFYERRILSLPTIVFSKGSAADGGEFSLDNSANDYGVMLLNSARIIDGARVVVKRAWRLVDSTEYVARQIAQGKIKIKDISDGKINANFFSDMSDSSVQIGGVSLTQRCINVFNEGGGTPSELTTDCGWLLAQGGNPLFCDHVYDSPEGCLGHNNQFAAGLIPQLAIDAESAGGFTPVGGGGFDPFHNPWGGGGGPCFIHGTLILVPGENGPTVRAIETLEAGDPILVWDFTARRLVASVVTKTIPARKVTAPLWLASGFTATPSLEQRLWTGIEWRTVEKLPGVVDTLNGNYEFTPDAVVGLGEFVEQTVRHLHVRHEEHNYIVWCAKSNRGMVAHNVKPLWDPDLY